MADGERGGAGGTVFYRLGDRKECPECRQSVGVELFAFRGSLALARRCLDCRRRVIGEREEGAALLPRDCPGCGERRAPGSFIAYTRGTVDIGEAKRTGATWDGRPEVRELCAWCARKAADPARAAAREAARAAREAQRRAAKAGGAKGPGRPELVTLAAVARVLEGPGVPAAGLTLAGIEDAMLAGGVPVAPSTLRRKVQAGQKLGFLLRERVDVLNPGTSPHRYRLAPGVTAGSIAEDARRRGRSRRGPGGGEPGAPAAGDPFGHVPHLARWVAWFLRGPDGWGKPATIYSIAGNAGRRLVDVQAAIAGSAGTIREVGRDGPGDALYDVAPAPGGGAGVSGGPEPVGAPAAAQEVPADDGGELV